MGIDKMENINQVDSNGRMHGLWRLYYDQLWREASYINGVNHGFYKGWDVDGNLRFLGNYVNGVLEGEYIKYEY